MKELDLKIYHAPTSADDRADDLAKRDFFFGGCFKIRDGLQGEEVA